MRWTRPVLSTQARTDFAVVRIVLPRRSSYRVRVLHRRADDLCAECQFVVVACGSQEAAFKFCNDEEQSGFFDLAVVSTGRSKEFGTTHFKIRKVVGMVQEPIGSAST